MQLDKATITKTNTVAGAGATVDWWIQLIMTLILPINLQDELHLLAHFSALEPLVHHIKWLYSSNRVADHISAMGSSLCLSNIEMLEGCTDRSTRQITFEAPTNY
jgi:hypothetical protein